MNFWDKVAMMDRRIMWVIIFVLVFAILLAPLGLPITVGDQTRQWHDTIADLPDGGVLWIEIGYSAGASAELNPQTRATIIQAFRKDMTVVMSSLWAEGPQIAQGLVEEIATKMDKEYGKDWVNLGYKPGGKIVAKAYTSDVVETAKNRDHFGDPIADMPIIKEVPALTSEYVDFIAVISSGTPGGKEWLAAASDPQGIPMGQGTLQMSIPEAMPFLESGQYTAIIPGARGAAEYELLIESPGPAIAGQDVTSILALYLVVLLVLGNLAYYLGSEGAA
jgi:hypothetical protein